MSYEYLAEAAKFIESTDCTLLVTLTVRSEGIHLRGQIREGEILRGIEVNRIVSWIELTMCKVNPLLLAMEIMETVAKRSLVKIDEARSKWGSADA